MTSQGADVNHTGQPETIIPDFTSLQNLAGQEELLGHPFMAKTIRDAAARIGELELALQRRDALLRECFGEFSKRHKIGTADLCACIQAELSSQ